MIDRCWLVALCSSDFSEPQAGSRGGRRATTPVRGVVHFDRNGAPPLSPTTAGCASPSLTALSLVTRTSLKTPSCFLRSHFSRVREKRQGSNDSLFFRSSLRNLVKEKQARCFSARSCFSVPVFRWKRKTRL